MKTVNRFLIRLRNLVTGRRGDQRLREELGGCVQVTGEIRGRDGSTPEANQRSSCRSPLV